MGPASPHQEPSKGAEKFGALGAIPTRSRSPEVELQGAHAVEQRLRSKASA